MKPIGPVNSSSAIKSSIWFSFGFGFSSKNKNKKFFVLRSSNQIKCTNEQKYKNKQNKQKRNQNTQNNLKDQIIQKFHKQLKIIFKSISW